jgi:hypothetical protein
MGHPKQESDDREEHRESVRETIERERDILDRLADD